MWWQLLFYLTKSAVIWEKYLFCHLVSSISDHCHQPPFLHHEIFSWDAAVLMCYLKKTSVHNVRRTLWLRLSLCYMELLMLTLYIGLWNRVVEKDTRVWGLNEVDAIVPGEDLNWVMLYCCNEYWFEFILIYAYIIKLYCVLIFFIFGWFWLINSWHKLSIS